MTLLNILYPVVVNDEEGNLINPIIKSYPLKISNPSSKILSFSGKQKDLQYTISPIPGNQYAMQIILQSSKSPSLIPSLKQMNYWIMLPLFFKEFEVDAKNIGGIESVDIKLDLKYIMGKQILFGLIVENVETEDIWLGATGFLGNKDKHILQTIQSIGIKVELESKKSKCGENVWMKFYKKDMTVDSFIYLSRKGVVQQRENLDFEKGNLRFGVVLLTTSRSTTVESVTAMRQLQLTLKLKDSLFFQKVSIKSHDTIMKHEACETIEITESNEKNEIMKKDESTETNHYTQNETHNLEQDDKNTTRPFKLDWYYME